MLERCLGLINLELHQSKCLVVVGAIYLSLDDGDPWGWIFLLALLVFKRYLIYRHGMGQIECVVCEQSKPKVSVVF